MPMPHRTQMQLIKKRLVGKDDAERIKYVASGDFNVLIGWPVTPG